MAEDYAPLYRSIWSDDDFRALTAGSQRLYMALFSAPARNAAGLLGLTPKKWARGASDLTAASIGEALTELDATGFLVVDNDTEEVLVRAYIRVAKVYRHTRLLVRAMREIEAVESARLRSALGQELVRLPRLVVPERTPRNGQHVDEAHAAQQRLDELASMLCDAPPDDRTHPMDHGMGHGMGHPPGVGTGTGAGVGAGAVLGSSTPRDLESVEGDAGARELSNVVQGRWAR